EGRVLSTNVTTDAFTDVTELTVYGPSHPRLLAMIAGACAAAGANIVDAQISTTRDGRALDTIHLQREFPMAEDEERRGRRIARSIEELMRGEISLETLLKSKPKPKSRLKAFSVVPQVVIDNSLSDDHTVLEVNGLDRPGLLYELTATISDLNLDIASAHIATFGEKAVDVFYVTDLLGKKITSPERQAAIRDRLIPVLARRPGDKEPAAAGKREASVA
ncbi:MAG: ACT domain-containing protein, partial [Alphaproteobacteria bacterium]